MDYILGLDPGFTGAIALLKPSTMQLMVYDMPVIPNSKGKTELNMAGLHALLTPPADTRIHAILEFVASRPGQGAPATFRFGQGYGALQMALVSHQIPMTQVTPAKWKKALGLVFPKGTPSSKVKAASRGLATQIFPHAAELFSRVKDDGRAEAALMTYWAVMHHFPSTGVQ